MPAPTTAREDRIELRATREEKRLLATAAAYERLDVTSFIMRNVLPTARAVVDRAERIALSERDTVHVLELLENPPRPTPALTAAAPLLDDPLELVLPLSVVAASIRTAERRRR